MKFVNIQNISSLLANYEKLHKTTSFNYYEINDIYSGYIEIEYKKLNELKIFRTVLNKIMGHIVKNFFDDITINSRLNLDIKVLEILKKNHNLPYQYGFTRPDLLVDENFNFKICEINSRFTLNGSLISYVIDQALNFNNYTISPLDFIFLSQKKIHIIKGQEHGYDINIFANLCKQKGINVVFHNPKKISLNDFNENEIIFLELHQKELIELPEDIINKIINCRFCYNDLRTIFIGHDKRLLSLLSDRDFTKKYISAEECEILTNFIIPTFTSNQLPLIKDEIFSAPKKWVFKPFGAGKGEGIIFGKDLNKDDLKQFISSKNVNNFAFQHFFKPFKLEMLNRHHESENMNLVSMMQGFNDQIFGFGFFRASSADLVAVSRGGYIIPVKVI